MSAASRPLKQMIAETEEKAYREALHRSPTRTEAIKKLGVSRRTFYKKLREFGLQ